MMLKKWEDLPEAMQKPEVRKYYNVLRKHRFSLVLKRAFDFLVALMMTILLLLPMLVIAVLIAADSPGGVFYRQVRVTAYGKEFRIHKFRTMVAGADRLGSQVTVGQDSRITTIGAFLRKYRLDELPQVLDVLCGNMSYVGTRPEVPKYVEAYSDEMMATLLLPAGITSEASIRFKDEAVLLEDADDVDKVYTEHVLPLKMKYNLASILSFNFFSDLQTMLRTIIAVLGIKGYNDETTDVKEDIHYMHN